ncbi:uncharacterized protein LOC106764262 [Vigna radiata var. radiata]|uniref:Uncharacterized protein LOC106764262 n=1 Tax=Vigna radiata var. radiata TaxID=3916 RepID=A0A3Q0F692_VIGRR|nr:uncharacterized protein LOC106764262 [Vigna radiata var. radiata]
MDGVAVSRDRGLPLHHLRTLLPQPKASPASSPPSGQPPQAATTSPSLLLFFVNDATKPGPPLSVKLSQATAPALASPATTDATGITTVHGVTPPFSSLSHYPRGWGFSPLNNVCHRLSAAAVVSHRHRNINPSPNHHCNQPPEVDANFSHTTTITTTRISSFILEYTLPFTHSICFGLESHVDEVLHVFNRKCCFPFLIKPHLFLGFVPALTGNGRNRITEADLVSRKIWHRVLFCF